eukprot:scaffold20882_cov139-Skeletonema_marinoi.AAC.12
MHEACLLLVVAVGLPKFLTMPPCGVSLTKTHSLGEERERANIEHHNIYYVNAVPYYFHVHNIAIKPWSYCQGFLIKIYSYCTQQASYQSPTHEPTN